MRASTLVLIRHASMEGSGNGLLSRLCGRCDACVSTLGWAEIEKLRVKLLCEPPAAALYSSPLRRARETAAAAPRDLAQNVRYLRSIAEIHCGVVDGLPLDRVQTSYPDYWQRNLEQNDENFCWPGGETYREFRRRVLQGISGIAARHPGERVLVITHAGVISQILGALYGINPARWELYRPANTSLTEVRWNGFSGTLIRFDDHEHLMDLAA